MTRPLTISDRITLLGASSLSAIILAVLLARGSGAATTLRVFDWNNTTNISQEGAQPVSGTGIIPVYRNDFAPVAVGAVPSRTDARAIAVLTDLPSGTTEVSISAAPVVESSDPDLIAYRLASVRYRFNGQELYVSTMQPANLGLARPLNLGRLHGDIGGGRQVYISAETVNSGPNVQARRVFNVVSFVENSLVVTLASELPADQIVGFAKGVGFSVR